MAVVGTIPTLFGPELELAWVEVANGEEDIGPPPCFGLLLSPKIPRVAIFPYVGEARLNPPVRIAVAILDDTLAPPTIIVVIGASGLILEIYVSINIAFLGLPTRPFTPLYSLQG